MSEPPAETGTADDPIHTSLRALTRGRELQTGQAYHLTVKMPKKGRLLEMEDVHFHFDSAVLLPDFATDPDPCARVPGRITGLAVLVAALRHADANPDQKLLIAGHTDTVGPDAYNQTLSGQRADAALHALLGNRDEWVAIAKAKNKTEDVQQILKWASAYWWWACDPGEVDGVMGPATRDATKGFQAAYNLEFDESIGVDGAVGPQTWGAIFDVYERTLEYLLETDADGLRALRDKVTFVDDAKRTLPVGERYPKEQVGVDGYRSATNRRVELLFFDPDMAPPDAGDADYIYDAGRYAYRPIKCPPLPKPRLKVQLYDVAGLYEPGFVPPADRGTPEARASGYRQGQPGTPGYLSEDDLGRVFLNHIPRVSGAWDDAWKKDTQYVELAATVGPADVKLAPDPQVVWRWEDPDDPSNEDLVMRPDASRLIDRNDGRAGDREQGEDNQGACDHPRPGGKPAFEELSGHALTAGQPDSQACYTAVASGESKVRLHLTNSGGDNFRVYARLRGYPCPVGSRTGIITLWKRLSVEYVKMRGAHDLPVDETARQFLPAFVQMDFTAPREVGDQPFGHADGMFGTDRADFSANGNDDTYVSKTSPGEFQKEGTPGWFFLASALLPYPLAAEKETLFDSDTRPAASKFARLVKPSGQDKEFVVLPVELPDGKNPNLMQLMEEGGAPGQHAIFSVESHTKRGGKSYLEVEYIDYHPTFSKTPDGSHAAVYVDDETIWHYAGHQWDSRFHTGGFGFWPSRERLRVKVVENKGYGVGGISPSAFAPGDAAKSRPHFAGRTIVYTKHPAYDKTDKAGRPTAAARSSMLRTVVHELGHAFGFPHKCGHRDYSATGTPPGACAMCYGIQWLHQPGTTELERFQFGEGRANFCADHLEGIRKVHLEENPAMWTIS